MCSFCVLFFFFFKQKTAYEMRISDWSSDVCSFRSRELVDAELVGGAPVVHEGVERLGRQGLAAGLDEAGDERGELGPGHRRVGCELGLAAPGDELGRASCRERVCPYV